MVLHHRHKQRVLTTIITLMVLMISLDAYIFLEPALDMEVALLYSFAVAIGLVVAYQCYNYRHSHEHLTLVNTLTQIFLGSVLFFSAVLMLVLQALFGIEVLNSYLIMSVLVIALTFIFLKRFDAFLEKEVRARFPMGNVPSPKPIQHLTEKHIIGRRDVIGRRELNSASSILRSKVTPAPRHNPVKNMSFKHRGR